jgi:putative ABC transport system ATP-binding protein
MLKLHNISKSFQRGGSSFAVLEQVSLSVGKGELVSLLGRSGSGKTTLLNLTAGLLAPDQGQVIIDGFDLGQMQERRQSALRNQKIGYVPQGQSLLANLTVLDNVRIPFHLMPRQGVSTTKARDVLHDFGCAHLEKSYPASLSGGEMRRVALARALINSPSLILADEPTSDLDIASARQIAAILSALAQRGVALLVVTHDLELSRYADRALCLEAAHLRESADMDMT